MQISAGDIHHYGRRLELALVGLNDDSSISISNKDVIRSYVKFRNAQGLSVPRQVRYIFTLGKLSRLLGNQSVQEATRADLITAISQIEKEKRHMKQKEQRRNASNSSTDGSKTVTVKNIPRK